MCLLVLIHASAEHATNAFSSKEKYEKLAVVVHVPRQTTQDLVISRRCFADWTAKKCTNYNARAQLLFCSLNLLFGDVLVAFRRVLRKVPMTTFIRRISAVSNAIQTIDNEANHLIRQFDTAEMRRINRAFEVYM